MVRSSVTSAVAGVRRLVKRGRYLSIPSSCWLKQFRVAVASAPKESKGLLRGEYGQVPGEVNEEVRALAGIKPEDVITWSGIKFFLGTFFFQEKGSAFELHKQLPHGVGVRRSGLLRRGGRSGGGLVMGPVPPSQELGGQSGTPSWT